MPTETSIVVKCKTEGSQCSITIAILPYLFMVQVTITYKAKYEYERSRGGSMKGESLRGMNLADLSIDLAALQVVVLYDDDAIDGVYGVQMIDEVTLSKVHGDFSYEIIKQIS